MTVSGRERAADSSVRRRRRVYILLALALGILGLEGVREATAVRNARAERELDRAAGTLQQLVETWEEDVSAKIQLWLNEMDAAEELRNRETQLRRQRSYGWFDGFYLWDGQEVLWPVEAVDEDLATLRKDPCLAKVQSLPAGASYIDHANAYLPCMSSNGPMRLLAASDAAEMLLNADDVNDAESLIRSVGSLGRISLADAANYGVSVRRLTTLRLQHIQAMRQIKQPVAEFWLVNLEREIRDLDGEALQQVIDLYEYPILPSLKMLPDEAEEALARANRRIAVYQEVRDRAWDIGSLPLVSESPRILVDPYEDPPYLLFYGRLGMGDLVGGVQVDQPELIASLFEKAGPRLRAHLSVRDPSGRLIFGDGGPMAYEMAFTRVLPHLRVSISREYVQAQSGADDSFAVQLWLMLMGLVVGIVALAGLIRTDRQQMALIGQQREFIARVTHELKTPLAGIRLMAENLEMGMARDEAQRLAFARRIVLEAERLGERVDEVLKVATAPIEEPKLKFDPRVELSGLADRWRPLYEQRGAVLHVDLVDVGTVLSQRAMFRDAIYNLLDNALKYRKEGDNSHVWLRLRADRRWVVVDVEDNGMGVPADMRKAIFERFRRVEGPGRGKAGGNGLGLAFVLDAARALGGKVECREGTDGGARFLFRIPRR